LTLPTRDSNSQRGTFVPGETKVFSDFRQECGGADTRFGADLFYCHFVLEMFFYVW
jgi:hypothetical protein